MKKKFAFGLFVLSAITGVLIYSNVVSAQKSTTDTLKDPTELAALNGSPASPEAANSRLFIAYLNGTSEVPANASAGTGYGRVVLNDAETQITASFYWNGLLTNTTIGHIHGPAAVGVNAPILFNMVPPAGATSGVKEDQVFNVTATDVANLRAGLMYFNVHTVGLGGGEIRGQILAARAKADFDGDGRTDYGVVRQGPGGSTGNFQWYIQPSNGNTNIQRIFGLNTDVAAAADYDGDGKTDIATWRQSNPPVFYVLRSSDNTLQTFVFGLSGDIPISADYTGDGKADPAVYRSSNQSFWYFPTSGPFFSKPVEVLYGAAGDFPVPGDFNGDGKADFCVFHNTGGIATFNVRYGTDTLNAGPADTATFLGRFTTDSFIQGDFDGDGKADAALTRYESGQIVWYYLPSSGGGFQRVVWGLQSGDQQVPGDYDGDGKTDQAIYRDSSTPGANAFYVLKSGGGFLFQQWGVRFDTPVNYDVAQ